MVIGAEHVARLDPEWQPIALHLAEVGQVAAKGSQAMRPVGIGVAPALETDLDGAALGTRDDIDRLLQPVMPDGRARGPVIDGGPVHTGSRQRRAGSGRPATIRWLNGTGSAGCRPAGLLHSARSAR